jgi:hypothetical protein
MSRSVVVAALMALGLFAPSLAEAADELSTTDRLEDRRFVTTGPRAYELGTEAGRYPAAGFHTRGEMGGVWTPPVKLVDGIWFGVGDDWIGPATRFTSGYGHVRMRLPRSGGLSIERTDFVPGERRGVLVGLDLRGDGGRTVDLRMQTHSELMSIYPWGETKVYTQQTFNLQDTAAFAGRELVFGESGKPAAEAPAHEWGAAVGSALTPASHRTGAGFRGPQGDVICPASGPNTDPQPDDPCDDTAYGKGQGGELTYEIKLPKSGRTTVWFGVAGSESGTSGARGELRELLDEPDRALRAKLREREALARHTQLDLPGDRLLARGIEWSKQNLADSVQEARDLELREVNGGNRYPEAAGTLPKARFVGAGFPDYPWLFATDGEFTAFASVALGQFEPIKEHLRALRRASQIVNGGSGKVVHEVVTDGSVYFGANADAGNTDETAKFPSAVALIWRWTGDDGFRDEMYEFAKSNLQYIYRELDADSDGWPEGLGNVERTGMGEEKLDNTTATMRGLRDLEDLAKSKGDTATAAWAGEKATDLEARFENEWWMPSVPQHADSLDDPGDVQVQQRHWIGVTPMEIETVRDGQVVPGLTTGEHGNQALDLREKPCYGDDFGLYHTGDKGCDPAVSTVPAEKSTFTLNTSIMAVGEGNYGRLGKTQQQRFTTANRRVQLPDPDEQPGAMPEIVPSPAYTPAQLDRKFTERAMVLQAWGNYGTAWPVVHQQLGVRPDAGRRSLEVVPQVPEGQPRVAGSAIRLGDSGAAAVEASRSGKTYRTRVKVGAPISTLSIGHTLPAGSTVAEAELDGKRVKPQTRITNRGLEVTVPTGAGTHTLVVTAG